MMVCVDVRFLPVTLLTKPGIEPMMQKLQSPNVSLIQLGYVPLLVTTACASKLSKLSSIA